MDGLDFSLVLTCKAQSAMALILVLFFSVDWMRARLFHRFGLVVVIGFLCTGKEARCRDGTNPKPTAGTTTKPRVHTVSRATETTAQPLCAYTTNGNDSRFHGLARPSKKANACHPMLFKERNEYTVILFVVLHMIGKPSWFRFAGEPHPKHAAFLAVSDAVLQQNETRLLPNRSATVLSVSRVSSKWQQQQQQQQQQRVKVTNCGNVSIGGHESEFLWHTKSTARRKEQLVSTARTRNPWIHPAMNRAN